MRQTTISRGGQISVPAAVRRRWHTTHLLVEDRGDALVLRPMPEDPIGAAMGSLAGPGPTSEEARAMLRDEEAQREDRVWGAR
jgi:bifunctional DNA-binding transcriptional regulator/antitoxin component of YhaV-PrlF toxin-antitoxin module